MDIRFRVHNPHLVPIKKEVTLSTGEVAVATVDGFECELLSEDTTSGTYKYRAVGKAAVDEAVALFVNDSVIIGSFSAE
jgi:hypothetical protein